MADGRANNGGKRRGAGRPSRAEEEKLIQRFDRLISQDEVVLKLLELIRQGDYKAIRTYFEYRYGKPKESVDITSGQLPIQNFNLQNLSDAELAIILKIHERSLTDTDKDSD